MSALAIVPARGGSKRIPGKNIRPFLGKPVLGRVIEQLLAAGCFEEVMVSTDDAQIAQVARAHGAKVPFMRSAENSGDSATTAAVITEVLAAYARQGREFAELCCAYPTAVFVTPQLLRRGFALLAESRADSVVCVQRFAAPLERALAIEDGRLRMRDARHAGTPSNALPELYHDAGQCYWLRTAAFREQGAIFARHTVPLVLDAMQAQDINTEEDWQAAEFKFSFLAARRGG